MHRTEVMEALWPESDPEASGTNLRKALHFARLATGEERSIVNERGVLVLWPDARIETDVARFEAAAQRALEGRNEAACRSAADLYTGELLPDPATVALYEEVLAVEGAPQPSEAERAHALLAWALVHMNRGDIAEAERAAEEARAVALDASLGRELGEAAVILAKVAMAQG